jgi:hypothetical protein
VNKLITVLAVAVSPVLLAQTGTFSGPSILTQGTNSVGQRSGQDLDLQFNIGATGFYDTGMVPFAISKGSLVQPGGLSGVEANLGAYGRHRFRRSVLGLDYQGNFRHYNNTSAYDGSNQNLNLGYTLQKSKRIVFDMMGTAGTQTYGTAFSPGPNSIVDSGSMLFDNRTSYLQTNVDMSYLVGNSTVVTIGGTGYTVHRKANQLASVNGYNLTGSVRRQVGRRTTVGASYTHTHYDFSGTFGEADLNSYAAIFSQDFARTWKLSLTAGVYTSAVQGTQVSAVDPVIAALLGVSAVQTIFYRENLLPMGTISLEKSFRRSMFSIQASRLVNSGNGLYLASRMQSWSGGYSYTGRRRWSMSLNVGQSQMSALAQQLEDYRIITGTANLGFRLGGGVNLNAAYSRRHQDIENDIFKRDSSRISLGIFFQPGNIPISFH